LLLDAALATQRERQAPEGEIYATRRKLAHALLLQGQLDVAKLVLQEGIGETENVEQKGQLILDIGLVLINAGHFADALQRLTQGVEMMGRTPTAALVYMAQCYAGLREEDRADQLFREAIRRGTEECNGEPFHPAMELIYQRFYRFLKKRLGKKWNDEAKRVKKAVQQCQRGTTPMKMSLDD
jgi:tetratricopeptide (TPR) repeat protein